MPNGVALANTMNFIDTLERRFGRYAIPNLGRIIAGLNALVFVLDRLNPGFIYALILDPRLIAQGQVWRLITYIFIPETTNPWWIIFALMFFLMIVDGLEQAWGAFRFNLFYLLGMIGTTAAALIFGAGFSNSILNLSLLFAFARFFPDMQIWLFFVLPVRIKWLAWFFGAWLALAFVTGPGALRMAILVSLANYLIFFGPEIIAEARQRRQVGQRRRKYAETAVSADEPMNRCVVCSRSDRSNPELEFRVGPDGNDYCKEHLPPAGGGRA